MVDQPASNLLHSLPLTPTHSHSLPLTPTHSHSFPLTPTHSHSLPLTPTHSHSLPLTPVHSHSRAPVPKVSLPTPHRPHPAHRLLPWWSHDLTVPVPQPLCALPDITTHSPMWPPAHYLTLSDLALPNAPRWSPTHSGHTSSRLRPRRRRGRRCTAPTTATPPTCHQSCSLPLRRSFRRRSPLRMQRMRPSPRRCTRRPSRRHRRRHTRARWPATPPSAASLPSTASL